MATHSFAPGPWRFTKQRPNGERLIKSVDIPALLIGTVIESHTIHRAIDNARLIIAAPDMYAVLREIRESAWYTNAYGHLVCKFCKSVTPVGGLEMHEEWCSMKAIDNVLWQADGYGLEDEE